MDVPVELTPAISINGICDTNPSSSRKKYCKDSMPIVINYPFIDKSVYTVVFAAPGAAAPDRRLVFYAFKAYPEELCQV